MMKHFKSLFLFSFLIWLIACTPKSETVSQPVKVAFMADVHLQDVYGELTDSEYKGVLNPSTGDYVFARTMQSQLNSTRLFNENYFAFLAALDDIVARGIRYVVMPGDFSDDGQPMNVRGLREILEEYENKHGITFILTTGNHDPVRPFTIEAGKKDFLGEGGKDQAIMSKVGMYQVKSEHDLPVVVTKDICKLGYEEIIAQLGEFGFFPEETDVYWETPFTTYAYEDYNFETARSKSGFAERQYQIPPFQSEVPDVSYLVEPIEGLWFLAVDANVYVPKEKAGKNPENPSNYNSASIGYNNVLTHKDHLIEWVKKVTKDAERLGKTLILFSHYPMIDFNDDASDHIKNLMGDGKMQLHRVPIENVAKLFSDAGVKVHFGGHMHINDTGFRKYDEGVGLVNIQIPSLAAYIPAYKILTVNNSKIFEIETIVIDSVPRFKELFPLYEQEHAYLRSINSATIWDMKILEAASYHEFTNWHLRELVRLRFLKKDWPADFRDFLLNATGKDLLDYCQADQTGIDVKSFEDWTGFDMIYDFYRLRSADKLAIPDIGLGRIKQYEKILDSLIQQSEIQSFESEQIKKDLLEFAHIFHHFLHGVPANHFQIDLEEMEITNLE